MFPFHGQHYLSSFLECERNALSDVETLRNTVREGIKASGATLLQECTHRFDNDACTMVFLLSESHCSLHTYTEYGSVFIDLFTCGTSCHYKGFEDTMEAYLQPKRIVRSVVERGETHTLL